MFFKIEVPPLGLYSHVHLNRGTTFQAYVTLAGQPDFRLGSLSSIYVELVSQTGHIADQQIIKG